jgi:ferric-dicitrate binding protein FerR (iron transport regulator)
LAWRHRELIVHCGTIASIAHEFNRYNRTQIEVSDSVTANEMFEGVFDAKDPFAFIQQLKTLETDLRVQSVEGKDGSVALRLYSSQIEKKAARGGRRTATPTRIRLRKRVL